MADVIITVKLMPESPEIDLGDLKGDIEKKVRAFAGKGAVKFEKEPIGFGLTALKVLFATKESNSDTDKLEESLRSIDGVSSAEVIDVRRAFG